MGEHSSSNFEIQNFNEFLKFCWKIEKIKNQKKGKIKKKTRKNHEKTMKKQKKITKNTEKN